MNGNCFHAMVPISLLPFDLDPEHPCYYRGEKFRRMYDNYFHIEFLFSVALRKAVRFHMLWHMPVIILCRARHFGYPPQKNSARFAFINRIRQSVVWRTKITKCEAFTDTYASFCVTHCRFARSIPKHKRRSRFRFYCLLPLWR